VTSRRSRLEITLKVLKAVKNGVDKPTRIMYATNMSWNPTQDVLNQMVEEGYLSVIEEMLNKRAKKRFSITKRGLHVINFLEGADEFIKI